LLNICFLKLKFKVFLNFKSFSRNKISFQSKKYLLLIKMVSNFSLSLILTFLISFGSFEKKTKVKELNDVSEMRKLLCEFLFFFVFKYAKFTRVQCSSSGKTCINAKCSIILASRTESYISFSCDLLRSISNVKVEVFNQPMKTFYYHVAEASSMYRNK
jgi:hypothetical protein